MKYNNLTHKIRFIWNETEKNETNLSQIKTIDTKNSTNYNAKKINKLESDWNLMDALEYYNTYDEFLSYGDYYKDYEVIIDNFPLRFLSFINVCAIYWHSGMSTITNLISYSSCEYFVYIHDFDTSTEDVQTAKKTISLFITNTCHVSSYLTTKYQIYSKLKLTISNLQSYK